MATRTFQATFALDDAELPAVAYRVEERLGEPTIADVLVDFADDVDPTVLLGHAATLAFGPKDEAPHVVAGVVDEVTVVGSALVGGTGTHRLRMRLVSTIALLDRMIGFEIHQDEDVREIVTKVLDDRGVPASAQSWKLGASYPKRAYCVQYAESALDFVKRLLEEEGIALRVETGADGKEVVVFDDDTTHAPPIDGDEQLPFRQRVGMEHVEDAIYSIHERARVVSGKFVLRDYDFTRPKLDLTASAAASTDTDLEVFDYPGLYTDPAQGKRLARVRLEEAQVERLTLRVEADCHRLAAGRAVAIREALHEEINGRYVVTSVVHELAHGSGRPVTTAAATLLPIAAPFRPARRTPKPVIEGPQTARVVAPPGSPGEEIHTDEHGRVKVKFHWDLAPEEADKASCWMRVVQPQTSGSLLLPRLDWEVVVEFVEGDPDRPIVSGRLYNGVFMPPYALPQGKTRTTWRTHSTPGGGGSNEIRFEDKAGGEEIMIHAEYDQVVHAANDKTKVVLNCETKSVKVDSTTKVGSNQTVQVTRGLERKVGGDQSLTVSGNRTAQVNAVAALTVGGNASITVGGNQMEMDGNPLQALLALAAEKAAETAQKKAAAVLEHVDSAVASKVAQVLGPVNALQEKLDGVSQGMQAVSDGDLGAAGPLLASVSRLPSVGELGASLRGGGAGDGEGQGESAGEGARGGEGGDGGEGGGGLLSELGVDALVSGAIDAGIGAGVDAIGDALGFDSDGGGGSSAANVDGPEGTVAGVAAEDRAKGSGFSQNKVGGDARDMIGGMKVVATVKPVETNVGGDMTQTIGAARVEMALGNRSESVGGNKTEAALGLVIVAKGDENETVSGATTRLVGGAVLEKIGGNRVIEAGASATFIGAFHKVDAGTSITFKCGASEVVVDGGGVRITSPVITITAAKIALTKSVSEV
jgi:type VI secretion system secreted protein VgrG